MKDERIQHLRYLVFDMWHSFDHMDKEVTRIMINRILEYIDEHMEFKK